MSSKMFVKNEANRRWRTAFGKKLTFTLPYHVKPSIKNIHQIRLPFAKAQSPKNIKFCERNY
jgi:hypothetical protein